MASSTTIKGITVQLGGDTTKLVKSFKDLDTRSRGLQTELNKINKQLKFNPDSTSLLAMKQEVLAEKVEVTRETLKKLKDMQGEVERAAKNGTLGEDKYRAYQLEVETTEGVLKNLEKQLSETGDKFSEVQRKSGAVTFKNAEDKVEHFKGKVKDMTDAALDNAEKLSKGFDKVGDGLEKVGGVVNKGSAAAAAVLAGSVAAFKDLDEGYDVIVKKTGAVDSKFDGLKQTADELFGNSVFDMTDIGNAIGEVNTRFGYTDEVLKSVTEQYLQFAKINDADVSDSVAKTARIMQAWDISSENLPDLLGMITAKGQETGIAVGSLMDKVLDNNATFKEMGLSLEESINLMAQFEKNGINDSTALAAMKASVKNAAKEGLNLTDVLGGTIEKIKNAATDTEALQIATELFGSKGAAEMVNAIKEGRISFDDLSGSMSSYKDTVKKTYDATLDPLEESKQVLNNLKLAGADLAATALKEGKPMLDEVINGIKGVTEWLKKLSPEEKKTLTNAIKLIAVAGPAVTITGKISKGIGSIIGLLPKMAAATKGAEAAQTGLNAAMDANPAGALILAIAALTAAAIGLKKANDDYVNSQWDASDTKKFVDELDAASDELKEVSQRINDTTKETFENLDAQISQNSLIDTYQKELDELLGKSELTDAEKSKLDTIVSYLTDNVQGFAEAWDKYTIKDSDGNIRVVGELDEVRQQINDTIEDFKRLATVEALNKNYSELKSEQLEGRRKLAETSGKRSSTLEIYKKKLEEHGLSASDFEKLYNIAGDDYLIAQTDLGLTNPEIWDIRGRAKNLDQISYNELVKLKEALDGYNSELSEQENNQRAVYNLTKDIEDLNVVLKGNYEDAAATLMAYNLGLIDNEDIEKSRWGTLEELQKAARESGKNTELGVGEDLDELNRKIYSGEETFEQSLINRLAINQKSAQKTVDDTAQTIEDGKPKMEKAAEEFADPPKIAMQELPLESKKAGGNFVSGFVSALFDGAKSVWNAAQNIGKIALNAINDFLDIRSPSKKLYKSGRHSVGGFVLALRDGTKIVWNAAQEIGSTAFNAVKSFFKVDSLPKEAYKIGDYFTESFNNALRDGNPEAMRNAEKLAQTARDALGGKLHLLDENSLRAPVSAHVLTDYSVSHTLDFKRSAQLESMRNDIRVLSGEIDKLAQRPIRLYVAPDKFVGGTIDQTYEQLSVKIFEKERGL